VAGDEWAVHGLEGCVFVLDRGDDIFAVDDGDGLAG